MPYIPNNNEDRKLMLDKIGVDDFDDLLKPVPENVRLNQLLNLPEPLSELELLDEIERTSKANKDNLKIFAGGGVYDHFIPSAVHNLVSRPEYLTAYTPYQAEVSQGTLQVIYEFQTHICRLTGMDVANASMYDGASAVAEAASLALSKTRRNKIIVSETVNPLFREVMKTYLSGREVEIVTVPHNNGLTDFEKLKSLVDDQTACLIMAQPNFFGLLEDIETGANLAHEKGALMIAAVDPFAAVVLKTPGNSGVDIAVGEGQSLGIPLNFGGPLLGFFAVKKALVRNIPGRLVARTEDVSGQTGFVLTLQTREQHIRRDKATSNICTNQALCATMATFYISLMGRWGMKQVALLAMERSHLLYDEICQLDRFAPYFSDSSFIREFVIKTPIPAREVIDKLIDRKNILPGINLARFYPGMEDALMITATEKRTIEDIDSFVRVLKEF